MGAKVPLDHAKRLLRAVKGNSPTLMDFMVGQFKVSSVNDRTVKIGCHEIAISEAERVLGATC